MLDFAYSVRYLVSLFARPLQGWLSVLRKLLAIHSIVCVPAVLIGWRGDGPELSEASSLVCPGFIPMTS